MTAMGAGATMMLEVILPWFALGTAAMANGLCRAAVTATAARLSGQGFEHTGTRLCDLRAGRVDAAARGGPCESAGGARRAGRLVSAARLAVAAVDGGDLPLGGGLLALVRPA